MKVKDKISWKLIGSIKVGKHNNEKERRKLKRKRKIKNKDEKDREKNRRKGICNQENQRYIKYMSGKERGNAKVKRNCKEERKD